MFLNRNKKNNVYPCKPQFYYIKVGFKGVKIIQACFRDENGMCAQWVAKDQCFLHADSEDSDQTGRMPRLI